VNIRGQRIFGASQRNYSFLLAGLIPHARVKIYPGSAHGFLFLHHAEFAADVNAFLTAAG
jgi:pimeloyl-ACP methyl ester carboxylesterase